MGIDYTKRPSSGGQPARQPGEGQRPAAGTPVSLSKVTLTKSAPSVSLTKQGSVGGTMRVNLNWNALPAGTPASGGFFKRAMRGGGAIDLDLGCLYEFSDGTKGAVQALGNAFRDRNKFGAEALIWLDGDDRSGTNQAGENLYINLNDVSKIRRIMVYAFIYEGVANWAAADGVVTLFPVAGPQIEVRLGEHGSNSGMCGIAMLENNGAELSVRREVRYVAGHRELDQAYGWGMNWTSGRK